MTNQEMRHFRRVVVTLGATVENERVLATAVDVAALLRSSLMGLFVEDAELLDMAALPFTREIRFLGSTARNIEPERLEIEMKARAALARRSLQTLTSRRRIECRFDVVRGTASAALSAACSRDDLIVMARGSMRHLAWRRSSGASAGARRVETKAVLIAGALVPMSELWVPYEPSPTDERALAYAVGLASDTGVPIRILAPREAREAAVERAARMGAQQPTLRIDVEPAPHPTEDLLDRLLVLTRGMIVIDERGPLPAEQLDRLIDRAICPVLLIKDGGQDETPNSPARRPAAPPAG